MKKRVLSILLVLTMVFSLLPMQVSAADNCLKVSSSTAKTGETITVTYTAPKKVESLASVSAKIKFDSANVELTSVNYATLGTINAVGSSVDEANTASEIGASWIDVNAAMTVEANTVLISAEFSVKNTATGTSTFTVDEIAFSDAGGNELSSAVTGTDTNSASVSIISAITGTQDITGVTEPAKGVAPTTSVTAPTGVQANIEWYKHDDASFTGTKFEGETVYKAKITAKPDTGYIFADGISFTVDGAAWDSVKQSDGSYILTKTFPATDSKTLSTLEVTSNTVGTKKHGDTINKSELTVKATYDDSTTEDNYQNYEIVYNSGSALSKGDTKFKVKSGAIESADVSITAVTGKSAVASDYELTGAGSLTYTGSKLTVGVAKKSSAADAGDVSGSVSFTYCATESGTYNSVAEVKNAGYYKAVFNTNSSSVYEAGTNLELSFRVSPKALTNDMIVLGTQNTYNGTEQGVAISAVKDGTVSLIAGDYDYEVVSGNKATNVGNNTLIIKGKGNYKGTAQKTWTLQQATPVADDFNTTTPTAQNYTGNAIAVTTPTLKSSKTGTGEITVKYDGNTTAPTNAGSYTVTFDVAEGTNYKAATGLSIGTLTISAIDVSTLTATAPGQTTVAGVGTFNDPTITGVNSESVAGTFKYAYDSETNKSHDEVVNMLKTKSADEEVTLNYTFTPSNSNYTSTKTGSFKVTVKDIEFKVSDAAASADNAINSLTGDTAYGKSWNERISVKSDSITASVGGTEKEGTYTIVPDSGALTDRPGVGTKNYTVKFTSTDGTYSDVTVFTGSITVTAKPVTITGLSVDSKVYDGNTTATVTGTAAISGKVDGDDVTVAAGTAAFADKNVGNGKIVTFSSYGLSGADASNYSLSAQPASATANITAKDVTISGLTATTRDYAPGNKEVSLTGGTINPAAFSGDTVTVDLTNAKGTMDDENAGTSKAVTVTGVALSGTDAGNYKLTAQPTGVTVTINQIDPTAPTGLSGVKGQALSTVTLPAGWTWDNPSTTMNTTGSVSFKASYAGSTNYKVKSSIDVTVTVSDKEPVTISGLTATTGLTYNGSVQTGYTGTPSYSPAWTGTPVVTYYLNDGATKTTTANSGASGEGLAPKNAGNYMVTIAIPDSDPAYTGNVTLNFTIAKRTISVKADNKSMTVNGTLPTFTVSYGNFASGDSEATVIETKATASCAATGTSTGSFPITVSGTTTLKSGMGTNYEVGTPESGTLTVNPRSSSGGGGGSSVSTYSVTVGKTKNGTVSVSPKSAAKGDTVTVTVTPDKGYVLETLTVLDKNDKEIKITEKNGKYTFTMPASKVTVKATFMDDNTMLNYFVDVKAGDYFYDAVLWAAQKGITTGTDATHFSPNASCTRAQIVTFLWRAAGSPEPKSTGSFADVPADSYYAKAVAWAVENGITGGTGDGKFSPDTVCTREQAVTFLYRAAGSPAVNGGSAFSDVAENAYYANAVAWAEKNEITGGIGGGLFGSGNDCTRGQIVTFLYRAFNK